MGLFLFKLQIYFKLIFFPNFADKFFINEVVYTLSFSGFNQIFELILNRGEEI